MSVDEWDYRYETDTHQVAAKADGGHWHIKTYSKRGGWGRTTRVRRKDGDTVQAVAQAALQHAIDCPLV